MPGTFRPSREPPRRLRSLRHFLRAISRDVDEMLRVLDGIEGEPSPRHPERRGRPRYEEERVERPSREERPWREEPPDALDHAIVALEDATQALRRMRRRHEMPFEGRRRRAGRGDNEDNGTPDPAAVRAAFARLNGFGHQHGRRQRARDDSDDRE